MEPGEAGVRVKGHRLVPSHEDAGGSVGETKGGRFVAPGLVHAVAGLGMAGLAPDHPGGRVGTAPGKVFFRIGPGAGGQVRGEG